MTTLRIEKTTFKKRSLQYMYHAAMEFLIFRTWDLIMTFTNIGILGPLAPDRITI